MERDIENLVIPQHVALILDGNGRWAKKRGLPRTVGHKQGCVTVEQTVEDAARLGIRYLTVYGFSTENWKRSAEEVGAIMDLLRFYLKNYFKKFVKDNIRMHVIGEKSRLDTDIQKAIAEIEDLSREIIEGITRLEDETAANTGMTFVIAVNYGGRDEITRAVRHMMMDCQDGKLVPENVTEQTVASYLDTAGIPDPDLLIRTSGEIRLSNYLLWQLAYSEIYITDCLWPDFNRDELIKAIVQFNQRDRRFGGVKA